MTGLIEEVSRVVDRIKGVEKRLDKLDKVNQWFKECLILISGFIVSELLREKDAGVSRVVDDVFIDALKDLNKRGKRLLPD